MGNKKSSTFAQDGAIVSIERSGKNSPPRRSLARGSMRSLALTSAAFVLAMPARAETTTAPGFALSRFDPSERGSRYFSLESLDWRTDGRAVFGVVADYEYKPLVIRATDTDGTSSESVVVARRYLLGHLGGTINIGKDVRLGLDVPMVFYAMGRSAQIGLEKYNAPQTSAVGDLRLAGDWRFYRAADDKLIGGVGVKVFLPTGDPAAYAGDGKLRVQLLGNAAGVSGQWMWAARTGLALRGLDVAINNTNVGSEVLVGVAGGYRFLDQKLFVGPELTASTYLGTGAFDVITTPVDVTLGGRYDLASNWRVGAGVGAGLTRAFGEPVVRAMAVLEWSPAAEPAPAQECPVCAATPPPVVEEPVPPPPPVVAGPLDTDGDAVADAVDACPTEKGIYRDNPKLNGCPAGAVVNGQLVLDKVVFETKRDLLKPESTATLEKVLETINRLPATNRYRVEGHTDSRGGHDYNVDLSRRRAAAVVGWLVKRGIAAARFESQGFGPDKPIADNDTPNGMQANRRVEMHVLTGTLKTGEKAVDEKPAAAPATTTPVAEPPPAAANETTTPAAEPAKE